MRVLNSDLAAVVRRINLITKSPLEPCTKLKSGKFKANIGNYHLDSAYGGHQLVRMAKPKHTPGPWKNNDGEIISGRTLVALIGHGNLALDVITKLKGQTDE